MKIIRRLVMAAGASVAAAASVSVLLHTIGGGME